MFTSPTEEPRVVDDYEFMLDSGVTWVQSVDPALGDSIHEDKDTNTVRFMIGARKQPDLPAEDITIYLDKVILVTHRRRTINPPSTEEKLQWEDTFKTITRSKFTH